MGAQIGIVQIRRRQGLGRNQRVSPRQNLGPNRAVQQTRIQMGKAIMCGHGLGYRPLARGGWSINGNCKHHMLLRTN